MNGSHGSHYDTSCLQCHTTGFDTNPSAVNGGFDDAAAAINYDLSQIPALVADAANRHVDNFPQLPKSLQNMASIQCESCHGPGSSHPSHLGDPDHQIAGVSLDTPQCAQCHDSASGFQQGFYQWSNSTHPLTASLAEGAVATNTSCVKCHTGEGFIEVRVKGKTATAHPDGHGITCAVCHDPHYSPNAHQLRLVGDFTLDSGDTYVNAGLGGLCMRCHNSRVSNPDATATTSSRGTHHGPQADMLLGVNGESFGLPFLPNSAHTTVVTDTCVACHMAAAPAGATPPKVGGHTYSMLDEALNVNNVQNACNSCHGSLDSYDRLARGDYDGDGLVQGTQTEVLGLMTILRNGILANFAGTSVAAGTTGPISITSGGFAALSSAKKAAFYNYNYVWNDGSNGVHNTSYTVQLLQRSYTGVFGHVMTADYPNVTLRGPLTATSAAGGDWMLYQ
jgi:hypothetical protein